MDCDWGRERDVLVTNYERTSACNLVANGRFQLDISSACSKTDEASIESHIVWETYAPIMHTSYGGEYREGGSMVLWSAKGYENNTQWMIWPPSLEVPFYYELQCLFLVDCVVLKTAVRISKACYLTIKSKLGAR